MTQTKITLDEILNSDLMNSFIKEQDEALAEAGWTLKDVQSMADYIIKKSK